MDGKNTGPYSSPQCGKSSLPGGEQIEKDICLVISMIFIKIKNINKSDELQLGAPASPPGFIAGY